jgi:hypothetical protein
MVWTAFNSPRIGSSGGIFVNTVRNLLVAYKAGDVMTS